MEIKQMMAAFGALTFLGMIAAAATTLVGILIAKIFGEKRLTLYFSTASKWLFGGRGLAWKIAMAALALVIGYSAALTAASLGSKEWTLAPGAEKYFCEIDCHLAYSITGVQAANSLGPELAPIRPSGKFLIVSVRTRFDESTISAARGDSPLVPSPREISLMDSTGRVYAISGTGQQALVAGGIAGHSLDEPLRPGESYSSRLVFDVQPGATGLRLLIAGTTNPSWIGNVIIGDENSVWHKKVFLALPPVSE